MADKEKADAKREAKWKATREAAELVKTVRKAVELAKSVKATASDFSLTLEKAHHTSVIYRYAVTR